jgi:sugar lactone lactonase YvrE
MSKRRVVIVAAALVVGAVGVAGAATASEQAATAGPSYKVVGKWGRIGTSGNGVFSSGVSGVAVDKAGNVYVADGDNTRIQVFTAKGAFIRKWGSRGGENGQLARAEDVDIAPDGTVWVADDPNERLQHFSNTGDFLTVLATPTGELARGVAVDAGGNVYASVEGSGTAGYRRYGKTATGWDGPGPLISGSKADYRADDIEVSPDGTIYVVRQSTGSADAVVQRFSADGKLIGAFKIANGDGARGIGVDLDCNVWTSNTPQRRIDKHSPSGRLLATAAVPDLIANDIAVGPTGDVYVFHQNTGMVHFAENHAKPATAAVPGSIKVSKGKVSVKYVARGFACPAQVDAVATLKGKGVSGRGVAKVAAGKTTAIPMTVKAPAGKSVKATFTIVLKTNGRKTTETRKVVVTATK